MSLHDPTGIKGVTENFDTAAAAAKIKKYLKKTRKIPLNIAITGESGAGKSTLINAFRGITDEDEGAAPTGGVESTSEVTAYPHPDYPNVILWDLPGIGATKFPAKKYLKLVGLERFDFFIIISETRFRENDVKLAQEIQKMKKKFYFVRSKIDNDLRAERRKRDFSAERTLGKIRENYVESLQGLGIRSAKVFLVSSFQPHKYDFALLHDTLERELPELKRHAVVLAIPNLSLEIINEKKKAVELQLPSLAMLCSGRPVVRVPGLSISVNLPMLFGVVTKIVRGFGLDLWSLKRLAASIGVSYTDLRAVIKSPLAGAEITNNLLLEVMNQVGDTDELIQEKQTIRFIEMVGVSVPRGKPYQITKRALDVLLRELADDAQRLFQTCQYNFVK